MNEIMRSFLCMRDGLRDDFAPGSFVPNTFGASKFDGLAIKTRPVVALEKCALIIIIVCAIFVSHSCVAELRVGDTKQESIMSKEKLLGQIFTPEYLVADILDIAGYVSGPDIVEKHVIDNSCGDGAFLVEVVKRYCEAAKNTNVNKLKTELETYIHGIEIDAKSYRACLKRLDDLCSRYGLDGVRWDVRHESALDERAFDGRMDFVVGNPPYVRVHNLEDNFEKVKAYEFCKGGMTDLYLVFYEIGLKMLAKGGRLCYIAPSSWLNSVAGAGMRRHIMAKRDLRRLVDLGHFQPFNATAYTAIALFENNVSSDSFEYWTYCGKSALRKEALLTFEEVNIDDVFYLSDNKTLAEFSKMRHTVVKDYVSVKNGFATLADDVFIADEFAFTNCVIPVLKASTGKWKQAIYPYNSLGKPLRRAEIFKSKALSGYLQDKKPELLKGRTEQEFPEWYLYGRSQALKDVWSDKLAINTVVKDRGSIKLNRVKKGAGVYGGLYILSNVPEVVIRELLFSDDFIDYLRVLKKYKSGGYYTFSSKDLCLYLNYKIEQISKSQEKEFPTITLQRELSL